MNIHELNTKAITSPAWVALDDGEDTYKHDLSAELSTMQTAISGAESNIVTAQGDITQLQTNMGQAQGAISSAQGEIADLQSDLNALSTQTSASIGNLQTEVDAVEDNVADLKSGLDDIQTVSTYGITGDWESGTLSNGANADMNTRIRTADFTPLTEGCNVNVQIVSGYKYSISWYDKARTFVSTTAWQASNNVYEIDDNIKYMRVVLADTSDSVVDISISVNVTVAIMNNIIKDVLQSSIVLPHFGFYADDLRNGTVNNINNAVGVSLSNIRPTFGRDFAKVIINRPLSAEGDHYKITYTTYSVNSGATLSNLENRNKTDIVVNSEPYTIPFDDDEKGFAFHVLEVTSDGTSVPLRISNTDGKDIVVTYETDQKEDAINSYSNIAALPVWRNGSAFNPNNANGIAFSEIVPNLGATGFMIFIARQLPNDHKYRYQISTYTQSSGQTQWNSNRIVADKNFDTTNQFLTFDLGDSAGFCIAIYELDENNTLVPLRIDSFPTDEITIVRTFDESKISAEDYIIDSAFTKTPLMGTEYIGTIKGTQGFCKYNGFYYSSSGTDVLYKQDSNFADVSNANLALGHCNTLQLGHNGKAYASGWDDQKVYIVDLDTMEIEQTITLPTSGYTTVAVDDIANLMYIFQRDTTPGASEEPYNFITYDYANEEIISTRKTGVAFGAIQGLDYCNGRIFVTNGLGTNAIPNGYRIYDTNGNVLCEYIFNSMATWEPQGVLIDRDTYDIYIKTLGTALRKVMKF